MDLDDLIQEGALALYTSVEKCDPASGNSFLTYAGTAVINGMKQYIRSQIRLSTNRITIEDGQSAWTSVWTMRQRILTMM